MESSRAGSPTWSAVRTRSAGSAMPEAGGPRRAWTRTVHAPAAATASASWFETVERSDMSVLYGQSWRSPSSWQVGGWLVSSGRRGTAPNLFVRERWLSSTRGTRRFGLAGLLRRAADGLVEEALGHHRRRGVQVPAVDHQWIGHRPTNPLQVH